jgi:hypothetical protein
MKPALYLMLALSLLPTANAQEPQRVLSNSDIVNMSKSGIGDATIILTIQKTSTKFDISPDALIQLKTAGVSDPVLNAMLAAAPSSPATSKPAQPSQQDCSQDLDKMLSTFGSPDKIAAIAASRLAATNIVTQFSGVKALHLERVTVWTGSMRATLQPATGEGSTLVITPEFNYLISGKMTTSVPPAILRDLQNSLRLDPIYIAKHRNEYSCVSAGTEQVGNVSTGKLNVSSAGIEGQFNMDLSTGRLVRTTENSSAGQTTTDYSDWRLVDGIYVPFKRHSASSTSTSDLTLTDYQLNPTIESSWFQPIAGQVAASLTFKVLQAESVPYTVQTNGGISTACNISGSTSTTMTASTIGNTTYGNATSTPNLQMNCRTYDNSIRWQHVLNAMFVQASDGNAYIIACDRAWAWSKCVPLRAGDTFLAKRSDKGFVVQFVNAKAKEKEATYSILQSKSLQ